MTAAAQPRKTSPVVQVLRWLVRAYQLTLSALIGRNCRHLPTCSDYADEALVRFGAWPGLWLALARFVRCNPWGTHSLDPVPDSLPGNARWWAPWRYGVWTGRNITDGFDDG